MNERIQKMAYEFNNEVGIQWTNKDKLKFAELIVRECAELCDINDREQGDILREHFGVE